MHNSRAWQLCKVACMAGGTLATGDIVTQIIEKRHDPGSWYERWDTRRTQRFAIVGATLQGPYFYYGFGQLDKIFGLNKTLTNAMTKTLVSQLTLFPVYISLLFAYLSILEGKSVNQAVEKSKELWWPTFKSGAVFWPIANLINFKFVPAGSRVVYVGAVGVLWNAYISAVNNEKNLVIEVEEVIHNVETDKL